LQHYKYILIKVLIAFCCSYTSIAQDIQISGYVKDITSGETLVNAHIINTLANKGVITNPYGFFSISTSTKTVELQVSYVGYKTKKVCIYCTKDTVIQIGLKTKNYLEEVEVSVNQHNPHSINRPTGNFYMTAKDLESIPSLMGEKDILKSLQLMPGIGKGKEGSSGIFVRGGERGQNLILLDGVPVYNVNHLLGVFSVFTPEAVKSVNVYKGGFPARYGGRLSSVIDIRLKEGNLNNTRADITIGTMASKLLVEGPIKKGKAAYIVSVRRTYADLIYTPLRSLFKYEDMGSTVKTWGGYYFYDLNAKANFILNKNNRLYISAYMGNDKLFIKEEEEKRKGSKDNGYIEDSKYNTHFKNHWGNLTSSLRWNKTYTSKLFSNTTLTYSSYKYNYGFSYSSDIKTNIDTLTESSNFQNSSGIKNIGAAIDFDYYLSSNYSLKFGIKALFNSYLPGKHENNYSSSDGDNWQQQLLGEKMRTNEYTFYAENNLNISKHLSLNIGINGLQYKSKELNNIYFQPRIMFNYNISNTLTLKSGYCQMVQPIHLLVNNSTSYPVDIWVPATKTFSPSTSHQIEAGAYYSFSRPWELNLDLYWKKMNGILGYRNGESFFNTSNSWENKVTSGEGYSYGMEFLLKKSSGKSTGWIGYNLSWAFRQFNELNQGRSFPFKYDSRHQLNIVVTHKLRKNIDISASWVLASGTPITLSETSYYGEDIYMNKVLYGFLDDFTADDSNRIRYPEKAVYYSSINNYILPAYHRMDASINFRKEKKYGVRVWNISVYNIYNKNNPFYITYHQNNNYTTNNISGEYKNYSLFGFLPSVSYRMIIK